MIQYSDSSGEEEGSGAKGGRGSVSPETKAKVRFRYSRGTAHLLSAAAANKDMIS